MASGSYLRRPGALHCLDLRAGKVVWTRNIGSEYKVPQDFFGTASTPLVEGNLLIVNVGAPGGPCVVGLDKPTGREVWRAGKEWGPSYASPVPAVVHGKRRILRVRRRRVHTATGGLLSIDPANGRVDFSFPWRSRSTSQSTRRVRSSSTTRCSSRQAIARAAPRSRSIGTSRSRRVDDAGVRAALEHADLKNGFLYGFDGRNEPDASLACVDATSGKVMWRTMPEWTETFTAGGAKKRATARHLSWVAPRG